jgi:regulator of protease activity HflC (stomatin/prohibitin superfamily)
MNIIRRMIARRRLAKSLKPCPELRERRYRQMSAERRARAERNAAEIAAMIGGAQ